MTMKKVPALPAEAQAAAAHTVSTYSMGMDHEHLAAKPALPLWMIEITLDGTITVTEIKDSSCQVVIIHSNIWEKLRTPMKHKQVMFIESANGQANVTMGIIPSICLSVGEPLLLSPSGQKFPFRMSPWFTFHVPCVYQVPGVPGCEHTPSIH